MTKYIHGFNQTERERLISQNDTLSKYIYERIDLRNVTKLLEIGCGVGAQMIYVLKKYPHLHVTGVDIEESQLQQARKNLDLAGIDPQQYSLISSQQFLSSPSSKYDGLLIIWVLEHVANPEELLSSYLPYIISGSPFFITEVKHSNLKMNPHNNLITRFWNDCIDYQKELGGDANVGERLEQILDNCGVKEFYTKPFELSFDESTPDKKQEIFKYWIMLMKSAAIERIQKGDFSKSEWQEVEDIMTKRIKNPNSSFYYAFIQAFGKV